MESDPFHALAEQLDLTVEHVDLQNIFAKLIHRHALSNITYFGTNIPGLTDDGIFIETTYPDGWRQRYLEQGYVAIDPVVQLSFRRITPLDWNEIDRSDQSVCDFFSDAAEFGIGDQGLSFPIRGAHGETALFSINSHHTTAAWVRLKRNFMREFQTIAFFLHNHVLDVCGVEFPEPPKLSSREIECLKWAASGKTEWETAGILNISSKTVGFHLERAKYHLSSVTKTQAVAKAIKYGLI